MNMQKMGKLCKENKSMKLYRKGCTQYMRRAGTAGWPGMCTDILRAGCMWCRAWPCIARRRNCW